MSIRRFVSALLFNHPKSKEKHMTRQSRGELYNAILNIMPSNGGTLDTNKIAALVNSPLSTVSSAMTSLRRRGLITSQKLANSRVFIHSKCITPLKVPQENLIKSSRRMKKSPALNELPFNKIERDIYDAIELLKSARATVRETHSSLREYNAFVRRVRGK